MTNREFYLAVTAMGDGRQSSDRSLEAYLLALWQLTLPLAHTPALTGELFLQVLQEAFTVEAPPFPAEWHTAPGDEDLPGFTGFEGCLKQQVVDLHDMAESGALENEYRYFGIDSPRGRRWYNFHPTGYLECAVEGKFGGWEPDDDTGRVLVLGPVLAVSGNGELTESDPAELARPIHEIASVPWEEFRDFLWYGQNYE